MLQSIFCQANSRGRGCFLSPLLRSALGEKGMFGSGNVWQDESREFARCCRGWLVFDRFG